MFTLAAVAVSPTQVNLTWTASTDNVGVAGYDIVRDGTLDNSNTGSPSFSDTGLTPDTTYTYSVIAFDAAGNMSTPSTAVSITTPPVPVPPSAPANLTATVLSSGQVSLSWTAATPGSSPINDYQVTRNGAAIGTTAGTSYTDATVSPGTAYSYTVTAIDSNGLSGSASNAATATTPAIANLLANPGFETWSGGLPADWTTYGPDTVLSQSSVAHSGSYSVDIATAETGYAASGASAGGVRPLISSTTADVAYTGSCWVKASKAITLNIQLREVTQGWVSVSPAAITSLAVPTTTIWYQIQVSYTTVGAGDMLPFSVYSTNTKAGGATFEVDDCSLATATSTASAFGRH